MQAIARMVIVTLATLVLASAGPVVQDKKSKSDPPVIRRFDGAEIIGFKRTALDDASFPIEKIGVQLPSSLHTVRGQATRVVYLEPGGHSTLEISDYYEQQILEAGGEILFKCAVTECAEGGDYRRLLNYLYNPERWEPEKSLEYSHPTQLRYLLAHLPARDAGETTISVLTEFDQNTITGGFTGNRIRNRVVSLVDVVQERASGRPSANPTSSMVPTTPSLDASGRPMRMPIVATPGLDASGRPIQAPIAETLRTQRQVQVYINFVTDKADLQPSSTPVLNELLATLNATPDLRIDLIGHTDAIGGDAHNQELSKRRAAAVYLWLVQHGIARERLHSDGRGFLEPIAANDTDTGRALNRRVEVKALN